METFFSNAQYVEKYNAEHANHKARRCAGRRMHKSWLHLTSLRAARPQVSLNKFADLTNAEFKAIYTGANCAARQRAPDPVRHLTLHSLQASTNSARCTTPTPPSATPAWSRRPPSTGAAPP